MEDKKEKFYRKKWFTVLMLIIFAPVGIFLLFDNKFFTNKVNAIISSVFGVWFIFLFLIPTEEETTEENVEVEQQEQEEQKAKEVMAEEEMAQEEAEEKEDEEEKENSKNQETDEDETAYEETLVDTNSAKITLESISKVEDELFGADHYSLNLSIENKSDKTIIVQTDDVSIDGLMVTDKILFSEQVASGKKSNAELTIGSFDEDLPPLEEELEVLFLIIDKKTFDHINEEKVNVEVK